MKYLMFAWQIKVFLRKLDLFVVRFLFQIYKGCIINAEFDLIGWLKLKINLGKIDRSRLPDGYSLPLVSTKSDNIDRLNSFLGFLSFLYFAYEKKVISCWKCVKCTDQVTLARVLVL